jgi:rod shape-determining protein MreD
MIDPLTRQRLLHRLLFLALALVVLFLRLLPISPGTVGWPGPDLTLAMIFAWLLRRPEFVPALLIVGVVFLEDLMIQRPPGLWAVLVLLGTEFLRNREAGLRDLPFVLEWLIIGMIVFVITMANWLILAALLVPQTTLGLSLLQCLATLVVYPIVVAASNFIFGIRRAAPGEVDAFGQKR